MGRYYSGDIEGKFWFAVQSSNAADRFGVTGDTPNYLSYYFDEDNLTDIQEEIQRIENSIGVDNIKKIEDFFNTNGGYNDKILQDAGLLDIWNMHKSDYADLLLGRKIEKCVIENGSCSFDAEL